ncbi:serine protease inhibitor 88Ea-like isoform X2 [Onthophagus taurus]|uniref:serine protease inhibitor 88Ea-like isoform X2 n=1 Tax=Onthophagus taurus TaxID=166361 RepID=UPI000C206808|nr:serine protease inhibitor 88Ea-like isoform X2 [Onthophagus taurus]
MWNIILTIFVTVFYEIQGQCLTVQDHKSPQMNAKQNLYSGEQEFSLNLLRAVNQLGPNDNLFFSPYSTYHALLLAYFISGGQTESFLKKTLRLDSSMDKSDVMNAYKLDKYITQSIAKSNSSYEFTNANRIYVDKGIEIRDCIEDLFREEFEKANFATNPEGARLTINNWVSQQTHNMIKDLLPPGVIDPQTNLVLVNAGYFKGSWKYEFNVSNTKEEVFYITPSKQTIVDMMYMEGVLSHDVSDVLDAHILELPYKGEEISMYILLPPFVKEDGVDNTLKKLTPERFQHMIRNHNTLLGKTVYLSLPKFSLEDTIEMTPVLQKLGVGDLFSESANFSTLTNRNVTLGSALHKAKIEVNEQGTEAAASTVLFTFRSSRPIEPAEFKCNHPFIYIIYDKIQDAVVFMGVFRRPY